MTKLVSLRWSAFSSIPCVSSCLVALLIHLESPGYAGELPYADPERPRIALVLSGGGALGMAHIGVLKTLEEMFIPIDCVTGTSMGALVGGAYANGVSPDKMEKLLVSTDLSQLFDDQPPRTDITQKIKRDDLRPFFDFSLGFKDGEFMLPSGASSGYKFELFLKKLLNISASHTNLDFNRLPIPFRAVATDLESGDMKIFNRGQLTRIMRASMSLPAIVAPIKIEGRSYIDGGLIRNLPVDIGRRLCGDIVIAVNLGSKPKRQDEIRSSIDVAIQSLVLLTEQNVAASLSELNDTDILISPELSDVDLLSFDKQLEIIERGKAAAIKQKDRLAHLSIPIEDYRQWHEARFSDKSTSTNIGSISVVTNDYVTTESILREISLTEGEPFDQDKLHQQMEQLYGRGDFSYVDYTIDQFDDKSNLVLRTESKDWGPGYVRFGVSALTDFTSPTQFNLLGSYRRTWINTYGAEWRSDLQLGYDGLLHTEFIQPLQVSDGAFIAPYLNAQRYFKPFYLSDVRAGEYTISGREVGLDFGISGSVGEVRIGSYYSRINSHPEFGIATPLFTDEHVKQSGYRANFILDQIDDVSFPRFGNYLELFYDDSEVRENVSIRYRKGQAIYTGAYSLGEHTVRLHLEWGDELSGLDDLPIQEVFNLGGPGRLSGLYVDQLAGSNYDLSTVTYYVQLKRLSPQIGKGLYIGMSYETGKINDQLSEYPDVRINAGSLFVATETIFGTLKLSFGDTDISQHTWYLQLGPQFSNR